MPHANANPEPDDSTPSGLNPVFFDRPRVASLRGSNPGLTDGIPLGFMGAGRVGYDSSAINLLEPPEVSNQFKLTCGPLWESSLVQDDEVM